MAMKGFLLSLLFVFSVPSFAGLIESDFLQPGDNGAVIDSRTGIKWLDFSHTWDISFTDAIHMFADYRYATNAEVVDLISYYFGSANYGIDGVARNVDGSLKDEAMNFAKVFGAANYNRFSYGLYEDQTGTLQMAGVQQPAPGQQIGINIYGLNFDSAYYELVRNHGWYAYGTYLVFDPGHLKPEKPVKPEVPPTVAAPSNLILLIIGLIALCSFRKSYTAD
jgi:hypothetical protein